MKTSEVLDLIDGSYKLCPGLPTGWYEEKLEVTRVNRKSIRVFDLPVQRYESMNCLLWHKPNNRYTQMGDPLYDVCQECKGEAKRTTQVFEYAVQVDPQVRDARRDPSSNYPVSNLSPENREVRRKRLKKDRDTNCEKVLKYIQQSRK